MERGMGGGQKPRALTKRWGLKASRKLAWNEQRKRYERTIGHWGKSVGTGEGTHKNGLPRYRQGIYEK